MRWLSRLRDPSYLIGEHNYVGLGTFGRVSARVSRETPAETALDMAEAPRPLLALREIRTRRAPQAGRLTRRDVPSQETGRN